MTDEETKTPLSIADLVEAMGNTTGDGNDDFVPTTDVELTHEIVQTLFDPENLNMITDLTPREISGCMKIHVINDIMHQGEESVLTRMLRNYKELKISRVRLGRKELIQAVIGRQPDDVSNTGMIGKFIR